MRPLRLPVAAALCACALPASAQRGDSAAAPARDSVTRLAPVVTVARGGRRSTLELPYAISLARPDSARPGQRHVQLSETALALNGVVIADRTNPAQDPRVSIRGVGARSQFGVRGIRILRDGMPLTLPDGQTPIDYLDLEAVGAVEAMRGAASSLYGNASGGVIDFRTAPPPAAPLAAQVRASWAGYGSERYAGVLGGSFRDGGWDANYGYMQTDGYRAHAAMQATNGYGRLLYGAGAWSLELQTMGLDMPVALNPGALTLAELDSNPRMADPRSVRKDARKVVSQIQTGVSARRPLGDGGEFSAQLYGGTRDLYNPLTFAIVGVDRYAYGAGARAIVPGRIGADANRLTAGVDAQYQHDDRSNWANCNGLAAPTAACPSLATEQGTLSLQQTEIVSSLGPYVRDELDLAGGWLLSLGVRGDWTRFQVDDRFLADGDASGAATMSAVSPMAGAVWRAADAASLYANIAAGFETPTVTELTNQSDGSAGINPDLRPQRSWSFEVGAKGVLAGRTTYDVTLYDTEVRQELIPFQAPSGRTYYRNAGRTRRAGLEIGLGATAGPVELALTYGLSRFVFVDFAVDTNVYDGNSVPGVPEHVVQFAGTYRWRALWGTVEMVAKSRVYANDANSASAPAYAVVNLRVGGNAPWGDGRLQPVIGVANLFGAHYVGSVAVNAALGQYYEPAPGRVLTIGLTAGLGY